MFPGSNVANNMFVNYAYMIKKLIFLCYAMYIFGG